MMHKSSLTGLLMVFVLCICCSADNPVQTGTKPQESSTLANSNPQTSDSQKQESSGSAITLKVENAKTSESSPAENLKSISDLLGAIAWPIVFVVLLLTQRRVLAELLTSIVEVVGKSTRLKLGEVIDVEVDRSAKQVEQGAIEREVPSEEVEAATRVDKLVGDSPLPIIRQRMLEFAREYEATRSNLKPGPQRTRAMNAIAAKMRTLAIAARPFLSEFSQDEHSPGKRLAAITILQLIPNLTYIPWLGRRMSEEQPFVFFQASLALLAAVRAFGARNSSELKSVLEQSLHIVKSFNDGVPDRNTVETLTEAMSELVEISGKGRAEASGHHTRET